MKKIQGESEKQKKIYFEYDTESKPIGEGGMGIVYKGYRVDETTGIRKEVAIKVLHDDLTEEMYARAEREASIQMRHDNLVEMLGLISVYEKNKWGKDAYRHYVISEFLHGIELSDLLSGKFNERDGEDDSFERELFRNYLQDKEKTSIRIIRSVLSGVLALHDNGYIHRDIDPSNIMVTNDGCIKLIDFGIAKNLKSLGTNDKLMTASGKFMGKAEFASPELVLGDVKNQNYTTDIYALGILFYRLLVGSLPFNGSQYEVLQKQLKYKVPVKNIENKALAEVVKKATDKRQDHRYATIAEFRVAIDDAENYKPNILKKIGQYAAVAAIVFSLGFGGFKLFYEPNYSKTDTSDTMDARFNKALAMLNSEHKDSVNIGFKNMKILAAENFDKAKIELAVTYYPDADSSHILSDDIKIRRKLLGLNGENIEYLTNSINYIENVDDKSVISPDVYYLLGMAYFKHDNKDKKKVKISFDKSLKLLNKGSKPLHGFDKKDLEHRVKTNIKALQ